MAIVYATGEHIARITISNPDKANVLDRQTIQ